RPRLDLARTRLRVALRLGAIGAGALRLHDRTRTPAVVVGALAVAAQAVQVAPRRSVTRTVVAGLAVLRRPLRRAMAFRPATGGVRRTMHRRTVDVGGIGRGDVIARIAPVPRIAVAHAQRDAGVVAVVRVAVALVVVLGDRRAAVVVAALVATVSGAHVVIGGAAGQGKHACQSGQLPQVHGQIPPYRLCPQLRGAALNPCLTLAGFRAESAVWHGLPVDAFS